MCVVAFSAELAAWEKGVLYAEGQNLARLLMEAPANHITPTTFAKTIEERLAQYGDRVLVHKRYSIYCIVLLISSSSTQG